MTDLFAARAQMAMSLAFHILFAIVGIAMPLLMVIAEGRWLKSRNPVDLELAKRWSKGTAIMFAVGAVSGTVLSFELGLLWPKFMEYAGPIIGMPFSLEGFAFFLEAIFLGIYLYGWGRISDRLHLLSGIGVLISGACSGIFVVCANAWMNTPRGFKYENGVLTDVDPWVAMFNPAAFTQTLHMTLASFAAVGFVVAGIHAFGLLRDSESVLHRRAFGIAMTVGAVFSLLMPLSGDLSAKHVAKHQPAKFAAMESHWTTSKGAAFHLGGWPDEETETTSYAIEIPYLLSILAALDPDAEIKGLKDFKKEDRPPVFVTHWAFQIMIGAGMFMAFVGSWFLFLLIKRRRLPTDERLLKAIIIAAPMGPIAVEAGWTVTEVGRQPWVVYNIMRTSDAVTPMKGLVVPFTTFSLLYLVLGVVVIVMLKRHVFQTMLPAHITDMDNEDTAVTKGAGSADDTSPHTAQEGGAA